MAAAKGSEGDYMAVAVFCLEQARRAMALMSGAPANPPVDTELGGHEREEYYVLKLQHVFVACCILNGAWPSVFPSSARSAANTFIRLWKAGDAKQLRDALTHYEEALATPEHRLRGNPHSYGRVRGVLYPGWMRFYSLPTATPEVVAVLGKHYSLEGVREALIALEHEFSAVLTEPDDPWELREDG